MSVDLVAITFNHQAASAAIPLRRNRTRIVAVPEWRAPVGGDAVACFALDRLTIAPVTVQVRLQRRAPEADSIEVRAIPHATPQVPPYWWPSTIAPAILWPSGASAQYWFALYAALARSGQPAGPTTSPFGEIAPQAVTFAPSGQALETFAVTNTTLSAHGVNVHPVTWRWQFRRQTAALWTDFAFTRFRIFTVLSAPTLPWLQAPNTAANTQLPWVEVLEVACRWAAGTTTGEDAATRVTESLYALGRGGTFIYDCAGPDLFSIGSPHYTVLPGFFDCSEFLERMRGGLGNGPFVNCSDCASAVATFANVLGCDLSQSRMFGSIPFPLNPTRSIGTTNWVSACSIGAFSMHEVAWAGECGEDDPVYDASLEVDGDSDPTRAPHTPRLPVNMPFGALGRGLYRDRLAAPLGRAICQPQPLFRQRRFVV